MDSILDRNQPSNIQFGSFPQLVIYSIILSVVMAPSGYRTTGEMAHDSQCIVLLNDDASNLVY